jgi:glycine cleavage system H lipoate-binding protein
VPGAAYKNNDAQDITMNAVLLENRRERDPCIWMQASAVRRKFCRIDYDCPACRFDRALRRVCDENKRLRTQGKKPSGKRGRLIFWKDKLNAQPQWKRPCIHYMKGRIEFRICNREYKCADCEFDQYFNDQFAVHAVVCPVAFIDVDGMKVPHGFYLHKGHAWIKVEENAEVRVGLDDFALRLLGPLDSIEAPLVGKTLEQDRKDIKVKRGSLLADVQSPVSGVVTAINPKLRERGGLANHDPYVDGWILRLHANALRRELRHLMLGSEAEKFYQKEVARLYRVIESTTGPMATDGGQLGNDIYGSMPQAGWGRLVELFLHP